MNNQFFHPNREFWIQSLIFGLISLFLLSSGVYAEIMAPEEPVTISFQLTDFGDNDILRVSLMKEGENFKDGMARQYQNTEFNRESNTLVWTPCNDNACTMASTPTAGGNSGRDQLILEVTFVNPSVDISSCHSDTVCERLRGGTTVKSGMIEGYFKTGKTYSVSLNSLKAGIGESFTVYEI